MRRRLAALSWTVGHPALVAALLVVVTAALAWQIRSLEVDVSTEGAMAESDPGREYYERFKEVFGRGSQTSLLVRADDVFAPPVVQAIGRLTAALQRLPGVTRVQSLTTVRHIKGEGDDVDTGLLVPDPIPDDPALLRGIRAQALGSRLFAGALVSRDGRATGISVETDPPGRDMAFNRRFAAEVDALIRREAPPGLTIHQVGDPFVRTVLADYIWADQRLLIPVSAAVLVVVLLLTFRTLQGVVIPLVNEGISVVWALGLMAIFGVPVNSLTLCIPSLLIAIGFSEDVHMLTRYHHLLGQGHDKVSAIRIMLGQTAAPVLITTATTVAGFASFLTADVTMLRQFGYAACIGFTADFAVTMLALPLLLRALPVPRALRGRPGPAEAPAGRMDRALAGAVQRIGGWSLDHRGLVAAGTGLVVAASVAGWAVLRVDNDFHGFLRSGSVIRERIDEVAATIGGSQSFSILVDTGRPDGVKEPDVLRRIVGLQEFLAAEPGVTKTLSVADHVRVVHREMNGGDRALETVPDTRAQVAQYLLTIEGRELEDYVDFTASRAHVVVRHDHTGSWELSGLLRRLDGYLAAHFAPPLGARYTGDNVLLTDVNDYIVVNEIQSLAYAFILIALIHAGLFRSARAGLLSLVPNVVPALSVFGLMGLLGVALDVGTAPIASVALGIAVDDTIHFLEEYRDQMGRHGDRRSAILAALAVQGRPIVIVSLILGLGFSVLALSNFVSLVRFGLFSAFVMVAAMAAELILGPVILSLMPPPRRRPAGGAAS